MVDPVTTAIAKESVGFIFTELIKHIKEWKDVRELCNQLQRQLDMCVAFREDVIQSGDGKPMARAQDKAVGELAHDIEDCIERFKHRITCKDEASWFDRKAHALRTWRIRQRFAKEMKKLDKRSQKAGVDQIKSLRDGKPTSTSPADGERDFTKNPVCIDQAKQEILTLLRAVGTPEPRRLRVISIVGFGGSGKTTLAHAAYQDIAAGFRLRVWVNRTEYTDAPALLKIIIEKFRPQDKDTVAQWSDKMRLQNHLKTLLGNQSYILVLDDMNMNHWSAIEGAFHDNGTSSRIMVTVRTMPAAKGCRSREQNYNWYVYQMRSVGDEGSKRIACLTDIANHGTQAIREKCDGLPLALVSVEGHLRSQVKGRRPTIDECQEVGNTIGSFLHDNDPHPVVAMAATGAERDHFKDLRDVLMDNYTSLHTWTLRNSLLYLGIFPDGRHLNKNKIIGRWVAEGYAPGYNPLGQLHQADKNFDLLVKRTIIQPVGINTGRICKAPGIVHEFVVDKSRSENFIRRAYDPAENRGGPTAEQRHKRVRHFVVRGTNTRSSRAAVKMDLSHIRSMTVLRTVTGDQDGEGEGDAFLKFSNKYKVIRVLDLEECTEVNKGHMEDICKLWNLRYLGLGKNVSRVPKEISQLKLLERLHLSKEVETELTVDIVYMRSLIHLSGKFVFPESEVSSTQPQPHLVEEAKESELQTLSGLVASKSKGFLLLVPHMKKLKKVKICFAVGGPGDRTKPFVDAIEGYLEHESDRSLGLDFSNLYETESTRGFPKMVMQDLYSRLSSGVSPRKRLSSGRNRKYYYLTSLNLHLRDELESSMPQFIMVGENLRFLKNLFLCLTSVTQVLLSDISNNLRLLAHLKLKVDRIDGDLVIHDGKFQSLENLCFVVKEFRHKEDGSFPKIHVLGILPELRYFRLICQRLAADCCAIDINNLANLEEIELHAGVNATARRQWETAARNHPNRPIVLPFLSVDDPAGAPNPPPAAGAAQVAAGMPAAVAPAIIAPAHQVPVIASATGNNGPVLSEDGNAAPVGSHEAEIVQVANSAQRRNEAISATLNHDPPHPATSVSSSTTVQPRSHQIPNHEHITSTTSDGHPVPAS